VKIKIIVFIDWFVPAYKAGGPIKSVYNIVQTFKEEAEWYIVTSTQDLGDAKELEGIVINQWTQLDGIKVLYLDESNQNVEYYKKILNQVDPQVVYLNSLYSKNYTLLPIQAFRQLGLNVKLIIAPRGMFSKGALAIKPLKKKLFFIYAKLMGVFKTVIWHASSDIEKNEIKSVFKNEKRIHIAPNVSLFQKNVAIKSKLKGELSIIMVSRISPIKNIHILLKAVATSSFKNNIVVQIIGNIEDKAYYNECTKLIQENTLNIKFVGAIPNEQIKPYLQQSNLFCSPTNNENYGHAIVEALSFGLPIIISQNTPWRNLQEKKVGFDLPLEVSDFSKAIDIFVEMGEEEYNLYSFNAIEYSKSILLNPEVIESNRKLFLS
jgi:glycosyltransferase involved in cell wall biosynthesis